MTLSTLLSLTPVHPLLLLLLFFLICIIIYEFIIYGSSSKIITTSHCKEDEPMQADIFYYLPKGMLKLTSKARVMFVIDKEGAVVKPPTIIEQSFTSQAKIEPLKDHLFKIDYHENKWMNDEMTLEIDEVKGLLKTVNVLSEDKSPAIFSKIAEESKSIFSSMVDEDMLKAEMKDGNQVKIKDHSIDFLLDPEDLHEKEINWTIPVLDDQGTVVGTVNGSFKISCDAVTVPIKKDPSGGTSQASLNGVEKVQFPFDGILTRIPQQVNFTISPSNQDINDSDRSWKFSEQLPGRLLKLPVHRSNFIKKVMNFTLADGLLQKHEIKNPSKIEGGLMVPVNILKTLVSIPGQLFSFRIFYNKRESEAEATILQNLNEMKREIDEIKKQVPS